MPKRVINDRVHLLTSDNARLLFAAVAGAVSTIINEPEFQ